MANRSTVRPATRSHLLPDLRSGTRECSAPTTPAGPGGSEANLIDHLPGYLGLIIFYTGYIMWLVAIMDSSGETVPFGTGGAAMIVGAVIMLASIGWNIYNRWLVGGRTGQSLGKRVTKIKLISEQTDQPIGAMNAFLRDLVHILDAVAYVGYLWPLWDDKRQTFADKIMRTIVIDATSDGVGARARSRTRLSRALTAAAPARIRRAGSPSR